MGGGGGGLFLPETESKLTGARNRSCCFVHKSQNPKFRDRAFESSTFTKVADSASCGHETPVCCLLGLAPYSLELESKCGPWSQFACLAYKETDTSTPRTRVRVLDIGPTGNGTLQCANSVYHL